MTEEIETIIRTEDGIRLVATEWDDGGAWLNLRTNGANMSAVLTRAEVQQLMEGLQAILAKEVAA
jgi:hypothetical protein